MRMRGKKPIFNYKDTWNMDETLRVVIYEGLKKFKEVVTTSETKSVPAPFVIVDKTDSWDEDFDIQFEKWIDEIDKMLYAFGADEPDPSDYDFKWERKFGVHEGLVIKPTDEDEYERYKEDVDIHNEKVKEGLESFAKYFQNLWW